MGDQKNIVVLGGGVIGLTTALVLVKKSPSYRITVVAKHLPGDYDIEYASPWAGANYLPVGKPGTKLQQFEAESGPVLFKLARETPEAGIHFQDSHVYSREKDVGTSTREWLEELIQENPWFQDIVPNFRVLPKSELKPGLDTGTVFTSVCINTVVYLNWLVGQLLKNGVVLKRGVAKHVLDAASLHHSGQKAEVVINCTGLSSIKLGGVMDTKLYPGRGQIVLVRQEPGYMATVSGTDDGPDEATYVMTRAAGGGTILGGVLQIGNWESQPDLNVANRIMKRCVDMVPELTNGKGPEALDVIHHGVGLRPMREGGPRVEKENIEGVWVVHNYGHGGYGYQSSYGSAEEASRLTIECLSPKAKI